MKQLFRGLCLLICFHTYAFSQTESVTTVVVEAPTSESIANWQPFGVEVDALEQDATYEFIDGLLHLSSDELARQQSVVAFVSDSGLYSGFGTAWHRNYPTRYAKGLQLSPALSTTISTTTEINLNSLFKTSLSFDDGMDAPSFQSFSTVFSKPLAQVSLGYRNSF